MKLATTTGDFKGFYTRPAEAVELMAKTPFKHMDYNFYSDFVKGSYLMGDDYLTWPMEALETAQKYGMDYVQAHAPNINICTCDEEDSLTAMRHCMEICSRLGITRLVTHTSVSQKYRYPADEKAYFELNRAWLQKLYGDMERTGVRILIENSAEQNMGGGYFFMTADDMNRFIDFCGHPMLGACWDTGHANMRGVSQYAELKALGKNLCALHVQDNFGSFDEHIAPLMGTTDFDGIMRALLEIGYPGTLTLESEYILPFNRTWPHAMRQDSPEGERKLAHPSLEARICAENLLYAIGKHMLVSYDCFEE